MRDYEELVKRLRVESNLTYSALKDMREAADAIEDLEAAVEGFESTTDMAFVEEDGRTVVRFVPKWISVEERLPEPFVCVLAHIPGEKPFPTVKSAFLEKNGLWYSSGFRYEPEEITHWCEMPEPPKEET